ncbi:hypothetical protein AAMO2058_000581200 [Amorphochlora amoebiformis]
MLAPRRQGSSYNSFRDPEEPQHPPTLARIMSNPERQPSGLTEAVGAMQDAFTMMNPQTVQIENMEETYYCYICLSNHRMSKGYTLRSCGHSFCKPCLQGYLESQFKSRQTHPRCFYTDEKQSVCNVEISVADIKAVATEEALKKYTYFMNKEQNENFVDCPKCKTQQLGDPRHPWTVCSNADCDHEFCFVHQNQHPKEKACAEFEAEQRREERKNRSWRSAHTRPCPKCGVATEKNEGCNHMTCFVCKTGWCWLCGEIIGNQVLPDHYKSGECKGKQFTSESVPYMAPWEAIVCIMVPAFFFLLFSPIAFVMAIVVCILYPCLSALCCCSEDQNNQQGWNRCMG